MRAVHTLLLLAIILGVAVAGLPGPRGARDFSVTASTPSPALAIVSDARIAGRGDALNMTVWLNVTGSGQIAQAWVNVTFNTASDPSGNSLVQGPLPWTQPSSCVPKVASGWFLAWLCVNLHPGTYPWTIPASVPADASVGHFQRVLASTAAQVGTTTIEQTANASVWIAGAIVRITEIDSQPTDSAAAGQIVHFWVNATNQATTQGANDTGTATDVSITILLDAGLRPGAGSTNLSLAYPTLVPAANLSVSLETIVAGNLSSGTVVGIHVFLSYRDFNGHAIGPLEANSAPLYVVQPGGLSMSSLLAGAVIGLGAILTTLVVLLYFGQRHIVIDEVFLMHKSGILLRHVSQEPNLGKDDDLVASMFVAIQEFVRDSFRKEASLDAVSFGGRRAAVVRGELTILAAVSSHGDVEYMIPEMLAAVRAVEAAYWNVLVAWDGNMSTIAGVDAILQKLMRGEFRSPWRVQLA